MINAKTITNKNQDSCFVLGTAQLAMAYGIANKTGCPDWENVLRIIGTAWEHGVREFDTAQAYGESESILGHAISDLGLAGHARIITKLSPSLNPLDGQSLEMALEKSMERIGAAPLYCLMLHRETWLDSINKGLGDTLQKFIQRGAVEHVGISLYSPARALQALETNLFDMIQVPANVLDHRFADSGVFQLAERLGKQMYIRSVFLQGLLLMDLSELPPHMAFVEPVLAEYDQCCRKYDLIRGQVALSYIIQRYPAAKIIFGAETADQVKKNVERWAGVLPDVLIVEIDKIFSKVDEKVLDPGKWPA
jgi:aryl-alcohol dehydrogenase-like predicted oxidoreductase